ncbi:hypothetical protein QTP88_007094 [Uroleucon formosanum]
MPYAYIKPNKYKQNPKNLPYVYKPHRQNIEIITSRMINTDKNTFFSRRNFISTSGFALHIICHFGLSSVSYNNNAQCEIRRAADMMTYYEKHRSQCVSRGVCFMQFTPKSLTTFGFFTSYYVGNCIIESDAFKYNTFAISFVMKLPMIIDFRSK